MPGTNLCESSDDDMTGAPSNLDRVITLGLGDSGATDHLWDHTHKDLLYDTKPSVSVSMPSASYHIGKYTYNFKAC